MDKKEIKNTNLEGMLIQIYKHCVEKRDRAKKSIAKSDEHHLRTGYADRELQLISWYSQGELDIASDIIKIIKRDLVFLNEFILPKGGYNE
tara:strand:- start:68 stop:340 length:273 start_codon:yes stop_codon:yes gene_type:complete